MRGHSETSRDSHRVFGVSRNTAVKQLSLGISRGPAGVHARTRDGWGSREMTGTVGDLWNYGGSGRGSEDPRGILVFGRRGVWGFAEARGGC